MLRLVLVLLALLGAAAPLGPAAADDRGVCLDETSAPDAAIGACGRLISAGRLAGLDLARAYNFRARGHDRRGEFDRAIMDYSEAIRLTPYAVLYSNRAFNYSNKRDFDQAIADANRRSSSTPSTPAPTASEASPLPRRATTIARSRITTRWSGSIRPMPPATTIAR